MNFLFPTFLFGLFAIAIPLIIHLFNFRKHKIIHFTNVQFLKDIKFESEKKSKLKELLILLMRILAVACLVFAFSQPFIPSTQKIAVGKKTVSVYIDNSFSMENISSKGTLLESAKESAISIAKAYHINDRFQILTNDFLGKHQRLLNRDEFIEQVNEVKISSANRDINDVIKRQLDFLQNTNSKNKQQFFLSDFQKNTSRILKENCDTSSSMFLIPIISEEVNNVFIDSAWFESPVQQFGTTQTLNVSINNASKKNLEAGTLKLLINQKQVSLTSFNLNAKGKQTVKVSFTIKERGINYGILKIDDYPVSFDDAFYFSFNSNKVISTLVINGVDEKTSRNFSSLFQNDSMFVYQENREDNIDYNLFSKKNLIILNGLKTISSGLIVEINKFVSSGGTVVLFPNLKSDLNNYTSAFKSMQLPEIELVDTTRVDAQIVKSDQVFFQGVFEKLNEKMDMPKVKNHFRYKKNKFNTGESVIILQNGESLLSFLNIGKGRIYLFSISSEESSSNFLKHALFVPTLIRIGALSLKPASIYYKTSTSEAIDVSLDSNDKKQPLHILQTNSDFDMIPEQRIINSKITLFTQNQVSEAGHYTVNQADKVVLGLGFNYDRKESDMRFFTEDELKVWSDSLGLKNFTVLKSDESSIIQSLKETNNGNKLWKLFLILALLFLLGEILIIRFFR
jgi:hypothetical protein